MFPGFYIFGHYIAMYGLLIVAGFFAGALAAVFHAKAFGLDRQDVFFALLYAAIGMAIGGKLLYLLIALPDIIDNWAEITSSLQRIISLLTGGFVFYGGLFGGIIGAFAYCRQYSLNFSSMLNAVIPAVPLMHAIGRLGCFFAGCCYGIPFPPPIGMRFDRSPAAPHGVALFPVQLLESALNFALFSFMYAYFRKPRHTSATGLYLICYAVIRLITELFRYDAIRGAMLGLSTSQWISVLLIPIGSALIIKDYKTYSITN